MSANTTAPIADGPLDVSERTVRSLNLNVHLLHDEGDVTMTFRDSTSTFQIDFTAKDARALAAALTLDGAL